MSIRASRLAAGMLLALPLTAAALEFEPKLTVGEIYTSNVNLSPDGREQSEWVTQVMPSIGIGYQGPRLDLRLDYALEALFYADVSDRNEVYNQLESAALFDLVQDELQLRADASIVQVNLAPEETITNSNINTTGDRTDAMIWKAGPQWDKRVFGASAIDGYLFVGNVNYNDEDTQDVQTTSGRVSLHTDERTDRTITYDLAYEYDRLDYDVTGETMVESAYLEVGYRLNESFRVFALGGLDNDFISIQGDDQSLDEGRWEVGVAGTFTADKFRVAAGHRHFGATYHLSWDHLESEVTYSLRYNESPSTSDLVVLRELPTSGVPGEELPPEPPGSDLDRPGNPTRFILKRADALASWPFYRTTMTLNAYWEDRKDQDLITETSASGNPLEDERSYGVDARIEWQPGRRSKASVVASWSNREINDLAQSVPGSPLITESDDLYELEAGLDYELGSRTTLGLGSGYRSRQGATADESGDYDEYWASVRLIRAF